MKDTLTERDLRTLLALKSALLDEKGAEIVNLSALLKNSADLQYETAMERDEALSRIAELEAAIGGFRRKMDEVFGKEWGMITRSMIEEIYRRNFPPEPSDPVADAVNEAWGWRNPHRDVTRNLLEALSRHGLTITGIGPCRIIPSMRRSEHGENETIRQRPEDASGNQAGRGSPASVPRALEAEHTSGSA